MALLFKMSNTWLVTSSLAVFLFCGSNILMAEGTSSILEFFYDAMFALLRIPRSPAGRLSQIWPLSLFLGIDYRRIYGGHVVDSREDYSFMARLEIWHLGRIGPLLCGGAIIHPQWILTAARCLIDEETGILARTIDITVGDLDIRIPEGTEQFRNGTPFVHPSYDRQTLDYDIGLVKLNASLLIGTQPSSVPSSAQPSKLNPISVNVITIPKAELLDSTPGNIVEIVGWGQVVLSGNGGDITAPFMPVGLRSAFMQVYGTQNCQNDWFGEPIKSPTNSERIPEITDRNLCLVATGKSSLNSTIAEDGTGFCTGDIGGPVIATNGGKKYLVGIMSFTKVSQLERKGLPLPVDTCSMKYPNVATKVRVLVDSFIRPTIANNS